MRAAKLHIMRTGRFPSFAELKAELCKASAASGGNGQGHNAALLRVRTWPCSMLCNSTELRVLRLQSVAVPERLQPPHGQIPKPSSNRGKRRLQAATKSPTPQLPSQSPARPTLPRPPPVTRLPFNDDPPPRMAANPLPARAGATRAPAAEQAAQQPPAEASSVQRPDESPPKAGAERGVEESVVHAMGTGESSLQLLPAGGAARAVSPVVAAAPPARSTATSSAVVNPAGSAVSTLAAREPTSSLAKQAEPAHAGEGPPEPPHEGHGADHVARGGADDWRGSGQDHWRKGNYYLLLITVALVTLACIERRLQQHAREVRPCAGSSITKMRHCF